MQKVNGIEKLFCYMAIRRTTLLKRISFYFVFQESSDWMHFPLIIFISVRLLNSIRMLIKF